MSLDQEFREQIIAEVANLRTSLTQGLSHLESSVKLRTEHIGQSVERLEAGQERVDRKATRALAMLGAHGSDIAALRVGHAAVRTTCDSLEEALAKITKEQRSSFVKHREVILVVSAVTMTYAFLKAFGFLAVVHP